MHALESTARHSLSGEAEPTLRVALGVETLEALQCHISVLILHDLVHEDVLDAIRHSVHNNGNSLLRWLGQRKRNVGEDIKCD